MEVENLSKLLMKKKNSLRTIYSTMDVIIYSDVFLYIPAHLFNAYIDCAVICAKYAQKFQGEPYFYYCTFIKNLK